MMSGWWVVVDPRTPEERDASEEKMDHIVASWEAGVCSMWFLTRDLVKGGKAIQHSFSGYPNRFTVTAGELVPFIINGPPTWKSEYNEEHNASVTIYRDKLTALSADQVLTVDLWDVT
jgi:hypothetical protein